MRGNSKFLPLSHPLAAAMEGYSREHRSIHNSKLPFWGMLDLIGAFFLTLILSSP